MSICEACIFCERDNGIEFEVLPSNTLNDVRTIRKIALQFTQV